MKSRNLKEKLLQRPVKRLNIFLGLFAYLTFKHIAKKRHVTYEYVGDVKKYLHRPVVMLAQHCSREEFMYTIGGFPKTDLHVVIGYQNYFQKKLYWVLSHTGTIPKYLYQPDTLAVRKMLSVVRHHQTLLLYPEGIQSTSGRTQPINPTTIKLLMKCRLPIILCTAKGSYLTRPRYSAVPRIGKMQYRYEVLFTPEELDTMTEDEVYQKLLAAFRYNDFEYNRTARIAYRGKVPNITGLDNIIYRCPICQSEFKFQITGDTMTCTHCGNQVTMDEYYDLHCANPDFKFADIDQWFQWQRRQVRDLVADPNFKYCVPVTVGDINLKKLKDQPDIVGEGTLTLTPTTIIYAGTHKGTTTQIDLDLQNIPSMPFSPTDHSVDIVYNDQYYSFIPTTNPLQSVKITLMIEELHNRLDPMWRRASEDVYEY